VLVSVATAKKSGIRKDMEHTLVPEFNQTDIFQKYATGSLGEVYLNPTEMHQLMEMLLEEFPEVIFGVPIGKTYKNVTMHSFFMGLDLSGDDWEKKARSRPTILINGLHHARELSSSSMSVYSILRLLFGYVKNDQETARLLTETTMIFIPVVNVDGYESIANHYHKTGEMA
jgi:murein tripeptide amidase MpaA